jgi:hypothetical protein
VIVLGGWAKDIFIQALIHHAVDLIEIRLYTLMKYQFVPSHKTQTLVHFVYQVVKVFEANISGYHENIETQQLPLFLASLLFWRFLTSVVFGLTLFLYFNGRHPDVLSNIYT